MNAQMFGSRDFPTLKCKIALNLQRIRIAHYRKLKIAQLNALSRLRFSLQFTVEINFKVGKSRETFDYLHLPFNNSKKNFNNSIYMYDFRHCIFYN